HLELRALANQPKLASVFSGLVRAAPRRAAAQSTDARGSLLDQVAAVAPGKRHRLLSEIVQREAALVLGLASPSSLNTKQPLQELGLDSLMAVELRNRLKTVSALPLPATFLFDYTTVAAIAEHFLEALALDSAPAHSAA